MADETDGEGSDVDRDEAMVAEAEALRRQVLEATRGTDFDHEPASFVLALERLAAAQEDGR